MKRILITALFLTLLVSACAPPAPAAPPAGSDAAAPEPADSAEAAVPDTLAVVDTLGNKIEFETPPSRIVITGKAFFMALDAAYMFPEATERVAAMALSGQNNANMIPLVEPDFEAKATLQRDSGAEQIAAAQPDLVILKSYLADTLGEALAALNIPVVYVSFETPEDYTQDILALGSVFNNEARAAEINAYYQQHIDNIENTVKNAGQKPGVLMLYYNDKDGSAAFNVPPQGWLQTRMAEMAGGEPVWTSANLGNGWTTVSLEQIAAWDADHIFIIAYAADSADVVAQLQADPQWQAIRAAQEGHLHAFPGDFSSWDQPNSRWIMGLTWLATRIHPDLFAETDMVEQTQAFYEAMYSLTAETFEAQIQPILTGDLP